jgi:hypothetical protein
MANKDNEPNKKVLIAGLICLLIGIGWFTYEMVRPLTPDEQKIAFEEAKREAEIKKNSK